MPPTPARSKPLAVGFGLFLATLGGGCSSSDADAPLVTQAQFPERFANTWCQSVAPCCAPAEVAYDRATCQTRARDFASTMLESRVTGDTTYSAAAAAIASIDSSTR
ncbi:MAG: hypothetical protein WDO74_28735 [Pseudomonadota bacterium]